MDSDRMSHYGPCLPPPTGHRNKRERNQWDITFTYMMTSSADLNPFILVRDAGKSWHGFRMNIVTASIRLDSNLSPDNNTENRP
jgi:hypothetical protein